MSTAAVAGEGQVKRASPDASVVIVAGSVAVLATALIWLAAVIWVPAGSWLAGALLDKTAIKAMSILLISAAFLPPVLAAMRLLCPGGCRSASNGSVVLEFVLLLPVALSILLIMAQSALLMSSNLVVHYAAWCAARSAAIVIAQDIGFEDANCVGPEMTSEKLSQIRQAAVQALVSIAPASDEEDDSGYVFANVAASIYDDYSDGDGDVRQSLINRIMRRYSYANNANNTRIELSESSWRKSTNVHDVLDGEFDDHAPNLDYGPSETIVLTLTHRVALTVPYANRLFGSKDLSSDDFYSTEVTVEQAFVNNGWFNGVARPARGIPH